MNPIKYIVEHERDLLWGLSVCTVGFETIPPESPYPSHKHGTGYYFSIEKGRVLHEYQLIYIPEGSGQLHTASAGSCRLEAGSMFILFPGEWHTYHPDSSGGWKQYWIGFKGVNMDSRVQNNFLNRNHPVYNVGKNEEIVRLYHQAIDIANCEEAYFQQMLAGITNYLLGLMYSLDKNRQFNKDKEVVEQINQARIYMREQVENPISIQDIATQTGMSYSHFRNKFKEFTGFSPAQYFQEIRLQRAKELLLTTTLSVKEIAYKLHFDSPDYFSTRFKLKTGVKPGDIRK